MKKKLPTTWTTLEGKVLNIVDMTTNHIENCIRMMQRNVPIYRYRLETRMLNYIAYAPEGAADCCESEMDQLEEMDDEDFLNTTMPVYTALRQEMKKRAIRLSAKNAANEKTLRNRRGFEIV
jgi:hypothetical protein